MQAAEGISLEQIQAFLETSDDQTLRQLDYRKLKRCGWGLVRRYAAKMMGLSRAEATRLPGMYLRGEKVQHAKVGDIFRMSPRAGVFLWGRLIDKMLSKQILFTYTA
jgi:hypothetical protein